MFKKIMIASLAVGALALQAPAALAAPTSFDCNFSSVAQETATGGQDTYTGAAYGYVAEANASVSIQCTIEVDAVEVAATPVGSGNSFATTAGQVTFTASDTQDVKLCAKWTSGATSGKVCFESTNTQFPPQEVIDALDAIFQAIEDATYLPDPLLCPVLATVGGTGLVNIPGVVFIDATGDVYVLDEIFWDCPPYLP